MNSIETKGISLIVRDCATTKEIDLAIAELHRAKVEKLFAGNDEWQNKPLPIKLYAALRGGVF